MSSLKIVSLNVNGLGSAIKRRVIFSKLRAQKADICLVQETHSTPDTGFLSAREWGGQILYSHGSPSSKGVAILLNPQSTLQISSNLGDDEGRFLAINVSLENLTYTICSVYSPTQDKPREQKDFLNSVNDFLSQLQADNIILGGILTASETRY